VSEGAPPVKRRAPNSNAASDLAVVVQCGRQVSSKDPRREDLSLIGAWFARIGRESIGFRG
jgi:hypothetical protein